MSSPLSQPLPLGDGPSYSDRVPNLLLVAFESGQLVNQLYWHLIQFALLGRVVAVDIDGSLPATVSSDDSSVSPFDNFGPKTRALLNYLWDGGNIPHRSIGTTMTRFSYRVSSKTDTSTFRQLKNRANNDL